MQTSKKTLDEKELQRTLRLLAHFCKNLHESDVRNKLTGKLARMSGWYPELGTVPIDQLQRVLLAQIWQQVDTKGFGIEHVAHPTQKLWSWRFKLGNTGPDRSHPEDAPTRPDFMEEVEAHEHDLGRYFEWVPAGGFECNEVALTVEDLPKASRKRT